MFTVHAFALLAALLLSPQPAQALSLKFWKATPIQAVEASLERKVPVTCVKTCQLSDSGYALIRTFEGYSPYIYKDSAGLDTIGYGHLILKGEAFKVPLLPADAQLLLERDAGAKIRDVNKAVHVPLNANQFSALVSFTFNVGSGALNSSTLLKRVNAELHSEVPAQLMRWVNAGGKRIQGLVNRRFAEGELYSLTPNA